MDQGQGAVEALVRQVGVKDLDLRGREHAFVDHGARREGGEVDARQLVLNPLAQDEHPPLQLRPAGAPAGLTTNTW